MTQVILRDQIKKLIELQKFDEQIYSIKHDLAEKPKALELLKQEFEAKKTHLRTLEEQVKKILLDRKEKELELKTKEDAVAKAKGQLPALKTNKEFHAKQAEIESIKADQSLVEEKILLSYEESDKLNAQIAKEKEIVAQHEKQFLAQKKTIEDDVKLLEDRVKVLENQRKQIVPTIDRTFLDRYEKILENKHGIAIAPVKGTSCGGCFMNITHQQINLLKMHDNLVSCEMCSRILYIPDDL